MLRRRRRGGDEYSKAGGGFIRGRARNFPVLRKKGEREMHTLGVLDLRLGTPCSMARPFGLYKYTIFHIM